MGKATVAEGKKEDAKKKGDKEEAAAPERVAGPKRVLFKESVGTVLRALTKVAAAVTSRNRQTPILSHVRIKREGGSVEFVGTDMEFQLRCQTEMPGGAEDSVATADLKKLLGILKALPADQVATMTTDGVRSTLACGRSKFTLQSMDAAEFPVMSMGSTEQEIGVKGSDLLDLIERTERSMPSGDIRHYLNGLHLDIGEDAMTAVSTDGSRLSLATCKLTGAAKACSVIVPRAVVFELQSLAEREEGEVRLLLGANLVSATVGDVHMISKLIDGRFPDYRRVVPGNADKLVVMEREHLLAAMKRAALMVSEKFKGVRLHFKANTVEIQAENNGEDVAEEIGIDWEHGDLKIGFNVIYVIDTLESLGGDNVTLALRDGQSSVLITSAANVNAKVVIMPMRT